MSLKRLIPLRKGEQVSWSKLGGYPKKEAFQRAVKKRRNQALKKKGPVFLQDQVGY